MIGRDVVVVGCGRFATNGLNKFLVMCKQHTKSFAKMHSDYFLTIVPEIVIIDAHSGKMRWYSLNL